MWSSNCSSLQKWNELPSVASLNGSAFLFPARINYEWCWRFLVPGLEDKSHSIQLYLLSAKNPIIVIGAFSIIFNIIFHFLIYFCFILAVLGVHCCAPTFCSWGEWGLLSSCGTRASLCSGFPCCGAWTLQQVGFVPAAHRLSSCGRWSLAHRLSTCGS